MRRAQSLRHNTRPSLALGADDLGMLREGDESDEDVLRRQLLDKDRENDKVCKITVFHPYDHIQTEVGSSATNPDTEPPSSVGHPTATRDRSRATKRVQEFGAIATGNTKRE
jgi:hypothetical protein